MGRGTHKKESMLTGLERRVGASCSGLGRLSEDFEVDLVGSQKALNPKLLNPKP